ncbi:MAG: multidrug DMT transporter permease [Spirochaetaceae bacterium]|nr:MAG: multidrug DMT transporter permease [Spirochaetaceae bacterium]
MSLTALFVLVVSAFVHAGWNALGRRSRPAVAFYLVASLTGVVVLAPVVLWWHATAALVPGRVLVLLIPAGFFQMLYFTGLAGAYKTGDMSVAYPFARALPVLLVPIVTTALGHGSPLSSLAIAGMVGVTIGMVVIPHASFSELSWSSFRGKWPAFALLAGIGTTGYSIVDSAALSIYRNAVAAGAAHSASIAAPVIYGFLESLSAAVFLLAVGLLTRGARRVVADVRGIAKRDAFAAGIGIIGAYVLVLIAYGFADNVSYVVAFRQMSLPIGLVLAATFLRERITWPRVIGTALLVAGLVTVGVAG